MQGLEALVANRIDWDARYSEEEYIYGVEPNAFLAEYAGRLNGPILSLAEGEGRNAVFLAGLGHAVHCVDGSAVALVKAERLAKSKGVTITTEVVDLAHYVPPSDHFGSVISISAHLPSSIRHRLYPLVDACLKARGTLLLESYSLHQLQRNTGGPKDLDLLMSIEKIQAEFPHLEPIRLCEVEREVVEGKLHTGMASVIQFIGMKK